MDPRIPIDGTQRLIGNQGLSVDKTTNKKSKTDFSSRTSDLAREIRGPLCFGLSSDSHFPSDSLRPPLDSRGTCVRGAFTREAPDLVLLRGVTHPRDKMAACSLSAGVRAMSSARTSSLSGEIVGNDR